MTLQWSVIALVLYVELAFTALLLLPFISPVWWKKLFDSRLAGALKKYQHAVTVLVGILTLLLSEAVREVMLTSSSHPVVPAAEVVHHMKMFRAQRNMYIAGTALFLIFIIKALAGKISFEANLIMEEKVEQQREKNLLLKVETLTHEIEDLRKQAAKLKNTPLESRDQNDTARKL